MSSTANALTSGVQRLYDAGLLPKDLSQQTLDTASPAQLNQISGATVGLQQVSALLGNGYPSDSVNLSPEALTAILLQSNSVEDSTTAADYFSQAVNNQLTNNVNSAVDTFLPASGSRSGTNINVVG